MANIACILWDTFHDHPDRGLPNGRRQAAFHILAVKFERCAGAISHTGTHGALQLGNFGDCKSVGGGLLELRIDHGPGYRVYLARRGDTLVLLFSGGDKRTQAQDIKQAREYLADYEQRVKP